MTFLVTAVGGDIGTALVRCLKDAFPKSRIMGCDMQRYVQSRSLLDLFVQVPAVREETAYLSAIRELCIRQQVTHLFPVNELEIAFFSLHREEFAALGVELFVQSERVLALFSSKYETVHFLRELGISVPHTYLPGDTLEPDVLPVVVKPDRGCGSRGVCVAKTEGQLSAALADAPNSVIQQHIGDAEHEYTMALFGYQGRVASLCLRRKLGYGGMSAYVETVHFPWQDAVAQMIARGVALEGCINVQFRVQKGQYYVFEVNPRISSTVHFRHLMGFTDAVWWVRARRGEKIHFPEIEEGLVGVKVLDEAVFGL